jgi:RimJ/RimL family protein N-acetyltransferase
MQSISTLAMKCFWQSETIRLRPLTVKDADLISAEEQDSEGVRLYEGKTPPFRSPEFIKEFIEHGIKQPSENILSFAVETLAGALVGEANIRDWNNRNGTFMFGIRIYLKHQRHGYATEAVRLILRYGFHELRCQKANSTMLAVNEASIHLHQKLGFKEEGRIRRSCYTDGQYFDKMWFGLTREEYDEYEQRMEVVPVHGSASGEHRMRQVTGIKKHQHPRERLCQPCIRYGRWLGR